MEKIAVYNNRLLFENRGIDNLSKCSEKDLYKVARKYQIGTHMRKKLPVEVMERGRLVSKMKEETRPKTRAILEREIRDLLTVTYEVPREYWTAEQQEGWNINELDTKKSIEEIEPIRRELGISIKLLPYEKGLTTREEALRIVEVEQDVFSDMINTWNHHSKREKDADGVFHSKKVGRSVFKEYQDETKKKSDAKSDTKEK